jgi:hypothetical protein
VLLFPEEYVLILTSLVGLHFWAIFSSTRLVTLGVGVIKYLTMGAADAR